MKELSEIKTEEELDEWLEEKYKDLPDGIYDIGSEGFLCYTGKGGFIEFEKAMILSFRTDIKLKQK